MQHNRREDDGKSNKGKEITTNNNNNNNNLICIAPACRMTSEVQMLSDVINKAYEDSKTEAEDSSRW